MDILSKILSSFSQIEELAETQLAGCQGALWTLIESHPRQAVKKRACGALANLSSHLSDSAFKTLIDSIRNVLVDSSNMEIIKTFAYGLAGISKSSGSRIGPFLHDWIDLILKLRKDNDDDEISEYCLQVLFYRFII